MKAILDEVENLIANMEEPAQPPKDEKADDAGANGVPGILNDNAGGGLGTIKDEDSNADSDFSGDEGPP